MILRKQGRLLEDFQMNLVFGFGVSLCRFQDEMVAGDDFQRNIFRGPLMASEKNLKRGKQLCRDITAGALSVWLYPLSSIQLSAQGLNTCWHLSFASGFL